MLFTRGLSRGQAPWTEARRAATAPLSGSTEVDVAVVGAGITGLTAALDLARAGCRVAVLENRRLGSSAPASPSGA